MNSHVIVGIRWVAGLFMEPKLILAWMTAKLLCICNVIDLYHLNGWLCCSRTCVSLGWHGGEQSGKSKKHVDTPSAAAFLHRTNSKLEPNFFLFFFTHSATISARFKLPHAKTERQKKVCSQPCIPLPLSHPPSSYLLLASSCWSQWVMQTAFQNMFKYTWYLLCDSLEEPHLRLSSTTNCKHSHWRQRQCSTWKYCVVEEVVILLQ